MPRSRRKRPRRAYRWSYLTYAGAALLTAVLVVWTAHPSASWLGTPRAARYVAAGYELSRNMRWEEALGELNRAVRADPRNAEAHYLRGIVLNRMGRVTEAIEELEGAVNLEPNRVEAYLQLARLYEQKGMYDQALASAMEAR